MVSTEEGDEKSIDGEEIPAKIARNEGPEPTENSEENIIFVKKIPFNAVDEDSELPTFSNEFYAWKKNFWRETLRERKITKIVAPMVDQSELAFRMMMRSNGADLCFTPMIHAQLFVNDPTYRKTAFTTCSDDRPLIVQFCGNDPDLFLRACRLVEGYCDGVDLNLGCPQTIARRGFYGAFLQEHLDLVESMVSAVYRHCQLPLSVKIRRLDSIEATIAYAKKLAQAGASMLTLHGRIREQKGVATGMADWSYIRAVKQALDIPVVANGNIQLPSDVARCLAETGADAVMSAEGVLSNPRLFAPPSTDSRIPSNKIPIHLRDAFPNAGFIFDAVREYLRFAERFKTDWGMVRGHIFHMCHYGFLKHPDLRHKNAIVYSFEKFHEMVDELERRCRKELQLETIGNDNDSNVQSGFNSSPTENDDAAETSSSNENKRTEELSLLEIVNQLPYYICKPYIRPPKTHAAAVVSTNGGETNNSQNVGTSSEVLDSKDASSVVHSSTDYRVSRRAHIEQLSQELGLSKKCIKKREKRRINLARAFNARPGYTPCARCKQPASPICDNVMCRRCCKYSFTRLLTTEGCKGHCFRSKPVLSDENNSEEVSLENGL